MTEQMPKQPSNDGAERAVLGCIFLDRTNINGASEQLTSSSFYYPRNAYIFEAMLELDAKGEPIDFQTIVNQLQVKGNLDKVTEAYLYELLNEMYYTSNFQSYVDIVKEKAQLRDLIQLGSDIYNRARGENEESSSILATTEQALLRINEERDNTDLTILSQTIPQAIEQISLLASNKGQLTGLSTGFRSLDNQLSGLQKSDLLLLAARPSMGKTALGVNIGYNVARFKDKDGNYPNRVAVFSLEMSKLQLSQRLLAMSSDIGLQDVISGEIEGQDKWERLIAASSELNEIPLYIDDTSSISIQELRSKCRRMKLQHGLDLIVIDYLQLMTVEDARRSENRQQEISTISRGLKGLAKEMNCPVLALSQLSRKAESREGARPMMSDMRESGAIEQDADVVMLLYREDYYDKDTENQNITDVIIAKHRNGPVGTVQLYFKKELTKFGDLSYENDPNAW